MATIKVKFRKSTVPGKAGSVYYQLCHGQSNKQITTRMRIFPHCWNVEMEELIITPDNSELLTRYAHQIEKDLLCIRRIIGLLDGEGVSYTLADVIARFHDQKEDIELLPCFEVLVKELMNNRQWGTARNLRRAVNSFSLFLGDRNIMLAQLDNRLVEEYEKWLSDKVVENSISFYMRTLRSAYNKMVKRYKMEQTFPFRNAYTGVGCTRKRAVREDVMVQLLNLDLKHSAPLSFSRDLFIFSYFMRGMTFVDIAFLKKETIAGGVINYVRHKTKQRLTIRIEPCIDEIIKRYESSVQNSPYVFPIVTSDNDEEAFKQYQTALGYHNRKLKQLGHLVGENLELSSYTARHSWATVARNHNVPISVISAGMGHTSEKTTLIYLDSIENSLVDKANEDILKVFNQRVVLNQTE